MHACVFNILLEFHNNSHYIYCEFNNFNAIHFAGAPKGIVRPVGGHLVALMYNLKTLYGVDSDTIWWATSDFGWVVGHSNMCYGPLCYGITSIIYEGKPTATPDPSSYFRYTAVEKIISFNSRKAAELTREFINFQIFHFHFIMKVIER